MTAPLPVSKFKPIVVFSVLGIVLVLVVVFVLWAIESRDADLKAMTMETPVTIGATALQDGPGPDESHFEVHFAYRVGGKSYHAHVDVPTEAAFESEFKRGADAKVCYDPGNPSRAALVSSAFTCGGTAGTASIGTPD